MRASTYLSVALVAGSAMGAPIALLRGNLNKRDHSFFWKRAKVSIAPVITPTPTPEIAKRQDVVTVWVDAATVVDTANIVVVTQVVTVGADNVETTAAAATTAAEDNVVTVTAGATTADETTPTSTVQEATTSSPQTTQDAAQTTQAETTTEATQETSTSSAATATSTGSINGVPETITYSPYNDDSSCKDSAAVLSDLTTIKGKGIQSVRIYGTDCNSISTVQPACQQLGLTIDQGFWIGSSGADAIDSGVSDLISWVQNSNGNDWGIFKTITVGNEAVYGGYIDGATLLAKIKSVKATLRSAGWTGTVTTAEPPTTYINYPSLCTDTDGIDYIGINAHPYFDASASPETAGDFVLSQISTVQAACNNRDASITETGYPSAGNTNGNNVPSKANQAIAIGNIMAALNNGGVMFTTYDDKWKSPGPYNVEQHFGIIDLF